MWTNPYDGKSKPRVEKSHDQQWRIEGTTPARAPPPPQKKTNGTQFFHFHTRSHQKEPASEVAPRQTGNPEPTNDQQNLILMKSRKNWKKPFSFGMCMHERIRETYLDHPW